jgi:phage gp36-like protein
MAYVSVMQLRARLGPTVYARLTDRMHGTDGDDSVGQQIVDEAEALVNSYLAARYATPIDLGAHPELADVLAARVLDLAEYLAWRSSPFVSDVPERIRMLWHEAHRWLEALAAGRIHLPAGEPPVSRTAEDDTPRARSAPRKFSAEELDGL